MICKALSVRQPWAALIAAKVKWIETRSWPTQYRGPLIIVSSLKLDTAALATIRPNQGLMAKVEPHMHYGKAIARVVVANCRPMALADEYLACCPVYAGAQAWVLQGIEPLEPFEVKGRLGLYDLEVPNDLFA